VESVLANRKIIYAGGSCTELPSSYDTLHAARMAWISLIKQQAFFECLSKARRSHSLVPVFFFFIIFFFFCTALLSRDGIRFVARGRMRLRLDHTVHHDLAIPEAAIITIRPLVSWTILYINKQDIVKSAYARRAPATFAPLESLMLRFGQELKAKAASATSSRSYHR
jgi:hypothetical protein